MLSIRIEGGTLLTMIDAWADVVPTSSATDTLI